MGQNTGIEWCHHTDNIVRGCTKISAGCANCYAEGLAKVNPKVLGTWGPAGERVMTPTETWIAKMKRLDAYAEKAGEVRRVFVNSMWDPGEGTPTPRGEDRNGPRVGHLYALDAIVRAARQFAHLRFLMLTKRPWNLVQWWATMEQRGVMWPERLWVGASVENQAAADERIPHLLKLPARVRFLSCEPLLGAVDLSGWIGEWTCFGCGYRGNDVSGDADDGSDESCPECGTRGGEGFGMAENDPRTTPDGGLSWVIVGGESGRRARPMHPDWARSLRDQCVGAGVAFFMKQMDAHAGADKTAIPADLMIREVPDAR